MTNLTIWQFIALYLVLQIIYVILNTITNITKIKCSKMVASVTSAICYGFYVIVVVATASEQPLWIKMVLTAVTNLVGVYFGMAIMEKCKKDKLWEITATLTDLEFCRCMTEELSAYSFSYNAIPLADNGGYVYHIYSHTQKESEMIKQVLDFYKAKYIVHEETVRL